MRVIAGTLKGRRLKPPTWEGLRPTSDSLRETLFNVLSQRLHGARVLDGYAGTGALGIEALSRGAARVVFVEKDRRAQALIADNLRACGVGGGYALVHADVGQALGSMPPDEVFDLILLDPPYNQTSSAGARGARTSTPPAPARDAMASLIAAAGQRLAADGVLVVEHARRAVLPERCGQLSRTRQIMAGDSGLTFYACQP